MTHHKQTRSDNCLQTCLASILDVPIDEAPDTVRMPPYRRWTDQKWRAITEWAGMRGRKAVFTDASSRRRVRALEESGEYYIATGPSGNGEFHCVVMRHGEIVHDPSGAGLTGPPSHYIELKEDSPGAGCAGVVIAFFLFLLLLKSV